MGGERALRDAGGSGDIYATYEGATGVCGPWGMMGVVVPAPMGLYGAAGHDGSERQKGKMAPTPGTVPEAPITEPPW